MHGVHWLEGWSVTQKVRALSSGESEFYAQGSGAARGLLMKHICHEAGEPKKRSYFTVTLLQVVAWRSGWVQEMSPHRGQVAVAAASHGREEVGNETCSERVEHC